MFSLSPLIHSILEVCLYEFLLIILLNFVIKQKQVTEITFYDAVIFQSFQEKVNFFLQIFKNISDYTAMNCNHTLISTLTLDLLSIRYPN